MRAVGYTPSPNVADTGRMWTKSLWNGIPWDQIKAGEREGHVFFDDFTNFPDFAAVDTTAAIYAVYSDASCDVSQSIDNEFGEVALTLSAATDDECAIGTSGGAGGSFKFIKPSAGVPHTIAFEARVKTSVLLGSTFVGFTEEATVAADGFLSSTGTLPDKDFVGFFLPEADIDGWDFSYGKASGTINTVIADVHTAVADTYVKLGFIYNYKNAADQQIKVYMNGVRQTTYVTKTLIEVTADFPAGEEMLMLFSHRNVTDIQNAKMDWWRAALVVNS